MTQNAFSIMYEDFFLPFGKSLLSGVAAKTISFRTSVQRFLMKTRSTGDEARVKTHSLLFLQTTVLQATKQFIAFFHPIQGSDIVFMALFLHVAGSVITPLASGLGLYGEWIMKGWHAYTAIIMTLGILLYFARRFLQLYQQEHKA